MKLKFVLLFFIGLLFSGCSQSGKPTLSDSKQEAIIGIWRGETGGGKEKNRIIEVTVTRIDAGLICIDRDWPEDSTQGIAGEVKFPLRKTALGIWEGEYHGQDGFGYSDFKATYRLIGVELQEHRLTVTDHTKKWDEHWTYHRYSQ